MSEYRTQRVVFTAPNQVALETHTLGAPGDDQIVIRTSCSLISAGTELMNLRRGERFPAYPGYSNVGTVVEVGRGVRGVAPGDRVVSQGGHATYAVVRYDPNYVQRVPDGLADDEATFTVLASVALHGVRAAGLALDEPVLVLGQGIVGQLVAQWAMRSGAGPVVVVDLYPSRLEKSLENGIDAAIDGSRPDLRDRLYELMPRGPAVVFDCTASPKGIPLAIELAGQKARVVAVTSLREPVVLEHFPTFQRKEITLIGIHQPQCPEVATAYHPWTKERNRNYILRLLATGQLKVRNLIGLRVRGVDAPTAYAKLREEPDRHLGALLEWRDGA